MLSRSYLPRFHPGKKNIAPFTLALLNLTSVVDSLGCNKNVRTKLMVVAPPFTVAVANLRKQKPMQSGLSALSLRLAHIDSLVELTKQHSDAYEGAGRIRFDDSLSDNGDEGFRYLHDPFTRCFWFPRLFILQAVSEVNDRPLGVVKTP